MTAKFKTVKGGAEFTTPKVTAIFPALLKADTKFSAEGVYKVGFAVANDAWAESVIEKANEMIKTFAAEKAKASGKKMKLSPDLPWVESDDGTVTFKAKIKAAYSNYTPEVHQFDAKGKPIKPRVDIKHGSEVKLNLELRPWEASGKVGISIRPLAVQVISLSAGGGARNADGYGFGEEDGFEYDEEKQSTPFSDSDADEEEDGELDF